MSENLIPITKASVPPSPTLPDVPIVSQAPQFYTEVINLPSKGWFYSPDSPLSSGQIELKQMTAKEEDILSSKNLIEKNIVLDKLLESVIINKSIKIEDILICDANSILFSLRRLAYGDRYDAVKTCPRCGKETQFQIDLSKMDNLPFEFEKYPKGENSFEFELPTSKVKVKYKFPTKKDDAAMQAELKGLAKSNKEVSRELTTLLKYMIVEVDGNSSNLEIRKFVDTRFLYGI